MFLRKLLAHDYLRRSGFELAVGYLPTPSPKIKHCRETSIKVDCHSVPTHAGEAAPSISIPTYNDQKAAVNRFVGHLSAVREELTAELANYQSFAATRDEFERIYECFETVDEIQHYLSKRTNLIAVFFPLNLPLYALCLYGIIPSLVADQVYIRTPQRMTMLFENLLPILRIHDFFPNINISFLGRDEFVRKYVTLADVTIFTGKLSNGQRVMAQTKPDSLFLFNGWGCNPIVVGHGADLKYATTKTLDARLFCSGQDCAAPDTILVHKDQASGFVECLQTQLSTVKIGDYHNPAVRVGMLADTGQIQLISSLFLKFHGHIVHSGIIDYQRSIVHPTIIVAPLSSKLNFKELFSPVFIISVYDCDSELEKYFTDPRYLENEMYITLFGSSPYVESMKRSIILHDQVVFDTDRGNDVFGGYSIGASFVAMNRITVPRPVLVPRDIFDFLVQQEETNQKLTPGIQKKIGKRVSRAITNIFGSNLEFGFLFGSVARGTAGRRSDINTMVVVKCVDPGQVHRYTQWLKGYHTEMKLTFKIDRPVEIWCKEDLEQAMETLESRTTQDTVASCPSLQKGSWYDALIGAQRGVAGNKSLAVSYRHRLQSAIATANIEPVIPAESRECILE